MLSRTEERVGHQSGVSAVPVWKRMDVCEPVMESSRCFINFVDVFVEPARDIIAEIVDGHRHVSPGDADVLVCSSVLSRPLPRFVEHPPVKCSNEGRREYITLEP